MTVTRFPNGVCNHTQNSVLRNSVGMPTPGFYARQFALDGYDTGFHTTATSSGTITQDQANLGGGVVLTTAATTSDIIQTQGTDATMLLLSSNRFWYAAALAMSSDANMSVISGLQPVGTASLAATQGVWIGKPIGGTVVNAYLNGALLAPLVDMALVGVGGVFNVTTVSNVITAIDVVTQPTWPAMFTSGGVPYGAMRVVITGGGGAGATAVASVGRSGSVVIQVVSGGSGYTTKPTIALVPMLQFSFAYDTYNHVLSFGVNDAPVFGVNTPTLPNVMLSPVIQLETATTVAKVITARDMWFGSEMH